MRRLAVVVGALVILAISAVVVQAATTGDERIYTCVNNGDGTIRQVAGADVACPRNWHKLSWSAENPPPAPPPHIPVTTTYKRSQSFPFPENVSLSSQSVDCDDGDVATGGGFHGGGTVLNVIQSLPETSPGSSHPDGWNVAMQRGDRTEAFSFGVYVVCQHTE